MYWIVWGTNVVVCWFLLQPTVIKTRQTVRVMNIHKVFYKSHTAQFVLLVYMILF